MKILNIIGIIALIFAGYFAIRYFNASKEVAGMTTEVITGSGPASGIEKFVPAAPLQPDVEAMPELPRDRQEYEVESPSDPYANQQESSDLPERMRNPERSFRPAPPNMQTPDSGVAGPSHMTDGAGYAQEMVQNDGEFMPGITAYENDGPSAFSMF